MPAPTGQGQGASGSFRFGPASLCPRKPALVSGDKSDSPLGAFLGGRRVADRQQGGRGGAGLPSGSPGVEDWLHRRPARPSVPTVAGRCPLVYSSRLQLQASTRRMASHVHSPMGGCFAPSVAASALLPSLLPGPPEGIRDGPVVVFKHQWRPAQNLPEQTGRCGLDCLLQQHG